MEMHRNEGSAGIYIHVPFCERKCLYCDFYSVEGAGHIDRYLAALTEEMRLRAPSAGKTGITSVYFGGGTPSLLTAQQLEEVLGVLRGAYRVTADAEVTIEVNPGTVTSASLQDLRGLGINRLSVGVQSFADTELGFLGRIHTAADARRCLADARSAGFHNISLDLIYSIPGQTEEAWERTLREALLYRPEHISAYSLIVEEHTPLHRLVGEGVVVPNDDAREALLYEQGMMLLAAAGYEQYEVSSYALPDRQSRHNASYWRHANYLGFGPSAHSFWWRGPDARARRWSNFRQLGAYCDALLIGAEPVEQEELLGARELIDERIFLSLRSDGLDLGSLRADFAYEPTSRQMQTLRDACAGGLAEQAGDRFRLTRQGYLLCDELCARMLVS